MESGELTDQENLVADMIANICYNNAVQYLGSELATDKMLEASTATD